MLAERLATSEADCVSDLDGSSESDDSETTLSVDESVSSRLRFGGIGFSSNKRKQNLLLNRHFHVINIKISPSGSSEGNRNRTCKNMEIWDNQSIKTLRY